MCDATGSVFVFETLNLLVSRRGSVLPVLTDSADFPDLGNASFKWS